jgi:hypothetical protein
VGSSLGGVLDSLGKALNPAQDQVSKVDPAASVRPATAAPGKSKRAAIEEAAAPAAARPSYQDAMGIEKGHELRGSDTPLPPTRYGIRRRG